MRPGLLGENNGARSYLTFLMFLNDNYDGGRTTLINPRDHSDRLEIEPTPGMSYDDATLQPPRLALQRVVATCC